MPLEDALQLVKLYGERGSSEYEKAAMRWLERYLTESSPRLQHFAEITVFGPYYAHSVAVVRLSDDVLVVLDTRTKSPRQCRTTS